MLLWLACVAGEGDAPRQDSRHSEPPDSADSADTADSGTPACPEGMAAVTDAEGALAFCIDAYEVLVTGELGDTDQVSPGATLPSATRESVAGVVPSSAVSWGQARAVCEAAGLTLATSAQWEDAADGVLGPGGSPYPYGEDFDPDACACGRDLDEPQPTGSLPDCVSPFGVWDSSGNLFEWTDPQRAFDVEAWLAGRGDILDTGGLLQAASTTDLKLEVAGVDPTSLRVEEGLLTATADPATWGYHDQGNPEGVLADQRSGALLPVRVVPVDALPGPARVTLAPDFDGHPITDKRGGSHYSGTAYACRSDSAFHAHLHTFTGSIGFRCVWAP